MTKLNQVIAIASGRKTEATKKVTGVYHTLQKGDLFNGFQRNYQPLDDEGETIPSEKKVIQKSVEGELEVVANTLADLFDVIATQETGNCHSVADIVVGGQKLAENVPVTYLLFLEKQMDNLHSVVSAIPTLSPDVVWRKSDTDRGVYIAETSVTNRTKKIPKAFVKAAATDKHPAQVDVFTEDILVGRWSKVDMSTAIPAQEKEEMIKKIAELKEAIKMAREAANSIEIERVEIGKAITGFIFN
jgi:hypothetical protein